MQEQCDQKWRWILPNGIGPLVQADEFLNHQIINTFGTVGSSDLSWTEKIWCSLARRDGSLQVDLGIGKYPNRNVLDGFAGISRGVEQWTVRASRDLSMDPDRIGVGAIRYEIIEPLRKVRFILEPNDVQPVSFDLSFEGDLPIFFEDRDVVTERGRIVSDVLRYHHSGIISGQLRIGSEDIVINPEEWFGFRDRSWGIRHYVGLPPSDIQPSNFDYLNQRFHFNWLVSQLTRPDGSRYELQYYFRETNAGMLHLTGHINEADGSQSRIIHIEPKLRYSAADRSFASGELHVIVEGPTLQTRIFQIEPLAKTGFRLHPALYAPWKGQVHGMWKGGDHEDGEYIPDCYAEYDGATNGAWQLRDRPVRIREGDAEGRAILESVIIGDWPENIVT